MEVVVDFSYLTGWYKGDVARLCLEVQSRRVFNVFKDANKHGISGRYKGNIARNQLLSTGTNFPKI